MTSPISLSEESSQARKVPPLWHPIPDQDLTPFLVGVQEMCIDWARRRHEDQSKTRIRLTPQPRILRVKKISPAYDDWEKLDPRLSRQSNPQAGVFAGLPFFWSYTPGLLTASIAFLSALRCKP